MRSAPPRAAPAHVYQGAPEEVFRATLETVRSLPGWEILTAHPENGEIRARARGRIFSPTMDHIIRLRATGAGTEIGMESRATRRDSPVDDPRGYELFHELLADRVRRLEGHRHSA